VNNVKNKPCYSLSSYLEISIRSSFTRNRVC